MAQNSLWGVSIQDFADILKRFKPACVLIPSNSRELKLGLFSFSQTPRNSMVFLLRTETKKKKPPYEVAF